MQPAWRSVALSDDVKQYDVNMRSTTLITRFSVVYPTEYSTRRIWSIIQPGSMTVGESDTGVKTFSRRCYYAGVCWLRKLTIWLRMNDPARRTVGVVRWCRTSVTGNWITQHKMQYAGQREQRGLLKCLPARRLQYQPSILRTMPMH